MKERNLSTLTRYRAKCQKLMTDLQTRDITMAAAAKLYGGSWYFYTELLHRGHIVREGKEEYIRWKGPMPSDKDIYSIARKVNNMNIKGHMKHMEGKTR